MVDDGDLRRAKELLSHFELVGHTEELPAFIEASRAVLGWPPLTEALTAKNSAPAPNRYQLSAAERAWTAECLESVCVVPRLGGALCIG